MIDPSKVIQGLPRFYTPEELRQRATLTDQDKRTAVQQWDSKAGVLRGLLRELLTFLDNSGQSAI